MGFLFLELLLQPLQTVSTCSILRQGIPQRRAPFSLWFKPILTALPISFLEQTASNQFLSILFNST